MSSNRHPEEEEAEYSERPSVPGASQASNADDKTISSKRSKLSLAPAFHSTPALPSVVWCSRADVLNQKQRKAMTKNTKQNQRWIFRNLALRLWEDRLLAIILRQNPPHQLQLLQLLMWKIRTPA
jgi:hypothetical protein